MNHFFFELGYCCAYKISCNKQQQNLFIWNYKETVQQFFLANIYISSLNSTVIILLQHLFFLLSEQGVDVILDPIGGSNIDQNIASIGMDGRWVLYGLMGGARVTNDKFLGLLLRKRVQLLSSTLRARSLDVCNVCLFMFIYFFVYINRNFHLSKM